MFKTWQTSLYPFTKMRSVVESKTLSDWGHLSPLPDPENLLEPRLNSSLCIQEFLNCKDTVLSLSQLPWVRPVWNNCTGIMIILCILIIKTTLF